jgi:tetratricopeptide (TPR) repeat protein
MGRKFLYFWNDYEIPDAEDLAVYRERSFVLARSPVGFGLVAGLGLAGLWFRRRDPAWRPLVWLTAASCASVVLFYVFGRYRLPVAPFLLPAAAAAAVRLAVLPRKLGSLVKGGGALTIVLLAFTYLPVIPAAERDRLSVGPRVNLGVAGLRLAEEQMAGFEARGPEALLEAVATTETAIADLERAAAIDPNYLPATVHLGLSRSRLAGHVLRGGDAEAAVRLYDEAERTLRAVLAGPGREGHPELVGDAEALLVSINRNRCHAHEGAVARRLAENDPEGALERLDAAADAGCTEERSFDYLRAVGLRELALRSGDRELLEGALASAARAIEAPGAPREWRDLHTRVGVELEAWEAE